MTNLVYLLLVALPFSHWHEPLAGHDRIVLSDTIPTEKVILYTVDSSVHHSRQQLFLRNLSKVMGLPSLHDGKHELYIRIWLWEDKPPYVLNIERRGSVKVASVLSWGSKKIDTSEYIVIYKRWPSLIPNSGWDQFLNRLNNYEIRALKGGLPTEKYDHLTHSAYVQFEIEEAGHYRYYEYLEPSFYRLVDTGANKAYRFLKYFNRQMNLTVYSPPDIVYEPKK